MYGVVCLKGGKIMNIQEQVADITKQAAQKLRQNGKLENVVWVAPADRLADFIRLNILWIMSQLR